MQNAECGISKTCNCGIVSAEKKLEKLGVLRGTKFCVKCYKKMSQPRPQRFNALYWSWRLNDDCRRQTTTDDDGLGRRRLPAVGRCRRLYGHVGRLRRTAPLVADIETLLGGQDCISIQHRHDATVQCILMWHDSVTEEVFPNVQSRSVLLEY